MSYYFDLWVAKPQGLPGPATVRLELKARFVKQNGSVFVGPDCVSMIEFEKAITALQAELEEVKSEAIVVFLAQSKS